MDKAEIYDTVRMLRDLLQEALDNATLFNSPDDRKRAEAAIQEADETMEAL